ncbi:MAG: hypothetical protein GX447_00355 [Elusimicrobia bacterium]|nr:hypothetical protein [Elusimicrobiota bacterium]
MADFKEKKTLEEILSDLNKILGKMPDLADKLKAPEIKPIDFSAIASEKSELSEDISPVLENKKLEEESKENLDNDKSHVENKQGNDISIPEESVKSQANDLNLQNRSEEKKEGSDMSFSAEPEQINTEEVKEEKEPKVLDNTGDFSVPDIDFLMGLTSSEKNTTSKTEIKEDSSQYEKAEIGGDMLEDNKNNKEGFEIKEDIIPEPEKESVSSEDSSPEAITSPESDKKELSQEVNENNIGEKTLKIDISDINEVVENKKDENISQGPDLSFEIASDADSRKSENEIAKEDAIKEASLESELEKFTLALEESEKPKESSDKSLEEKTLIFEPSSSAADSQKDMSQEEKTVVFSPSETNRIPSEDRDFTSVSAPEGVLPERIKNVGFIASDRNMLNHVLKTLDEICLSSSDKPMFINRSFILDYTQDLNSNLINQKASETSCQAVVAAGEFPHEKIYELETVFSSSNLLFANFKPSDFSKSHAIDFVLDLITR